MHSLKNKFKMEEQIIEIELKLSELNVMLQGLGELPAKVSFNLIAKIQQQANEQLKPVETIETK